MFLNALSHDEVLLTAGVLISAQHWLVNEQMFHPATGTAPASSPKVRVYNTQVQTRGFFVSVLEMLKDAPVCVCTGGKGDYSS